MRLDSDAIDAHWREKSPAMRRVFSAMERDEAWAVDTPHRLEQQVVALGGILGSIDPNQCAPHQRDALFQVVGFMHSSRAFRALSDLDARHPGYIESLLTKAQTLLASGDEPAVAKMAAQIHRDRFLYLDRFAVLSRVFSKERIAHLHQILEGI